MCEHSSLYGIVSLTLYLNDAITDEFIIFFSKLSSKDEPAANFHVDRALAGSHVKDQTGHNAAAHELGCNK